MKKFDFISKAQTLSSLEDKITLGKVLPQYSFTVDDFQKNTSFICDEVKRMFSNVIIRSSSILEDRIDCSNAGAFESMLNVDGQNRDELCKAIVSVINSYNDQNINNEILIQPFLQNVASSGVAFTADPDTLAQYFVINYDQTGKTDSITSGRSEDDKTLIILKDKKNDIKYEEDWIAILVNVLNEIEEIVGHDSLDVEFAVSKGEIYIFQVRPIVKMQEESLAHIKLRGPLERLEKKINKLSASHPRVLGEKVLFGVMPDWNPAEIIGLRPKRLSLSLYKELVTDSIWAYQRSNYGYRNLRSHPLMVNFLGIPYIDVRISFNSFIPSDLNEKTANKLANFYLSKLSENPHHHDKVEFEIVMSCFIFGIEKKRDYLKLNGFGESEVSELFDSLKKMTIQIISPNVGLFHGDMNKISILEESYEQILNSKLSLVDKIYWLMEDCKRYGTLPFAGIARSAFIATQILNSLVSEGILTETEKSKFLGSIHTVSKNLSFDLSRMNEGLISKDYFLSVYGHLRPGTYDINSLRYDENFDGYFADAKNDVTTEQFAFSDQHMLMINRELINANININAEELISFIKHSIEGREFSKFIFSRSLSLVLTLVEQFGKKLGISKQDIAFIDYEEIRNLYSSLESDEVSNYFKDNIKKNKNEFELTKAVKLPSLITKGRDVFCFYADKAVPSFITLKKITAQVVFIEGPVCIVQGKIAIIRSADPGYDYLFTKDIGGLITCFGGVNSHMAVRCAELGIPAAIGVGESFFSKLSQAKQVEIDSLGKTLRIIQ